MSNVLSFTEAREQRAELLPERTLLSTLSMAGDTNGCGCSSSCSSCSSESSIIVLPVTGPPGAAGAAGMTGAAGMAGAPGAPGAPGTLATGPLTTLVNSLLGPLGL